MGISKAMAFLRFLLVTSVFFALLGDVSCDGDPIWGRACLKSSQCAQPFSHCSRSGKGLLGTMFDGECRLNVWVWVVLVLVLVLIVVFSCCCVLYNACKCCRNFICFWKKD